MEASASSPEHLLLAGALGLALLLVLILRFRLHAFLALLTSSLAVGLAAQYPRLDPEAILRAMQAGMGGTLGFVAIVVGLGAMLGAVLEATGAAQVLARGLLSAVPPARQSWALGFAGFLISVPVFFDVALVVLMPLVLQLARSSGRPVFTAALPLLAGLVVTHAFVPPTPGPIGVAGIINADLGWVIGVGVLAGLPAMAVAGPLLASVLSRVSSLQRVDAVAPRRTVEPSQPSQLVRPAPAVPFGLALAIVLLPLLFILARSLLRATQEGPMEGASAVVELLGHPFVALLLANLVALRQLGHRVGLQRAQLQQLCSHALEPVGLILLVTGAGGVLKQVMVDMELGAAFARHLQGTGASPLVLAYAMAALIRVFQGSATVAMLTSAGLMVPLIGSAASGPQGALVTIAIASGATGFSHVNDSGFWLVNRYLSQTVTETFKTWTLMTTAISLVGLSVVLLLSNFV